MTKIYLVRHAESLANTQGIFQGQLYDTDLSDLGRKQSAAFAQRFAGIQVDAVIASPLKRTFQTAQTLDTPQVESDIIETNHGAWEGKSKTEIVCLWPTLYDLWLTRPSKVEFPGGETFASTYTRVVSWFNNLIRKPGNFVVVTHSNIIMSLLCHLTGRPLDKMWQYAMQPTAVTLVESHSPTKIIYLNDTSHLKGLESDLSTHAI